MSIIKLDAIDSTNDYLKQLSKDNVVENYTIVMANVQTNGKGQMGTQWQSESGKNVLMSVLVKDWVQKENSVFDFNIAVALAVANFLQLMNISNIKIKWPNDIMADGKKIAGILIENLLKADGSITAVVGIGLNVNQTNFEGLPNATSLRLQNNVEYETIESLAKLVQLSLQKYLADVHDDIDGLWKQYNESLFQLNDKSIFAYKNGHRFNGSVKYVSRDGKLALLHNDGTLHFYEVKEIQLLY